MNRISSSEQNIRELVNEDAVREAIVRLDRDKWNQMCVALDTLGDSAAALKHFEAHGLGSGAVEERYLRLYGTFQAVIIQQDSIKAIYAIVKGAGPKIAKDSGWSRFRELRNMAVGHPVDAKQGKLRVAISRITISDEGFDVLIADKNTPDKLGVQVVDYLTPYTFYKDEALLLLDDVESSLLQET